jgi:protein-S-isoprenylcysteine O-methyltransferase Ste14
LKATGFEFRCRFWIIGAIFWIGFSCYRWDHLNISVAVADWLAGLGTSLDSPVVDRYARIIFGIGTLVVTLAALIRSWAEAYLHSSIVHDMDMHSDRLVADGPYRYVRNPLYLGTILLAIGFAFLASRLGFFAIAGGMIFFTYRLILREEASLLQTQGESYRKYCELVPRLLPALRPRVPAGGGHPNWRDGFIGETFMWACALAMAVFTATLRLTPYYIILAAGFAVYFLQNFVRRRRRSDRQ